MRLSTNPLPGGQNDATTAAVILAWLQEKIDLMDIMSGAKRVAKSIQGKSIQGKSIQRNNKQ